MHGRAGGFCLDLLSEGGVDAVFVSCNSCSLSSIVITTGSGMAAFGVPFLAVLLGEEMEAATQVALVAHGCMQRLKQRSCEGLCAC